jgi:hypothetical protein
VPEADQDAEEAETGLDEPDAQGQLL